MGKAQERTADKLTRLTTKLSEMALESVKAGDEETARRLLQVKMRAVVPDAGGRALVL